MCCVTPCPLQEPPASTQVYSLCDMALSTIQGLAAAMKLDLSGLGQYAGAIILPRGLYRALDKAERGEQGFTGLASGGSGVHSLSRLAQLD